MPSFVNLDYADVVAAMSGAGDAHMGIGRGSGKNKVEEAAENAIHSPLLESSIAGARSVILSIAVPVDVELADVELLDDLGLLHILLGELLDGRRHRSGEAEHPLLLRRLFEDLLDIAEASAKAAIFREETRGHMYRADYPDMDADNWTCNVIAHYNDGSIECEKQDVVTIGS